MQLVTPDLVKDKSARREYSKGDNVKNYEISDKYGAGNIDLTNRPVVKNDDGSISTVRSMSFSDGKNEILIPTVVNGEIVSDQDAINHYYKTGEYLGKFNTIAEADNYAKKLHEQQEKMYAAIQTPKNLEEIRRNYEASFVGPKYQAPKQPEPIIEQSSAGDVLPTDMIKLPYEDTSYGANFKRNVVQPTESFFYGIGKASGGGKIERMITGDTPEQLAQREAQAIKNMGNHEKLVRAGETVGGITTPLGLNFVGVPAPLAFGSTAALNKAAETDDLADIAVTGAKAAAWAKLAGAAGSKYTQGLGKIPITQSNIPANFAKNFVGNFAGAATANYGLGSAEDLYNYARGREVDNAQTLKNAVLNPSNLVYAGIQGYKGTVSDINASKAKLQQDVRNTTQEIQNYKNLMNHPDTKYTNESTKQALINRQQGNINRSIEALSNNKYLGGKNQLDLEKAVEALRLGNPPPVEIPKAQLALPAQAGQSANSTQNVSQVRGTSPAKDNLGRMVDQRLQNELLNSKARDSKGNLILLYHGTDKNFDNFDMAKAGERGSLHGQGINFTTNKRYAQMFKNKSLSNEGQVVEAYLDLRNPFVVDEEGLYNKAEKIGFKMLKKGESNNRYEYNGETQNWYDTVNKKFTDEGGMLSDFLKDKGYDGIISGSTYVAFNPNQVHSVNQTVQNNVQNVPKTQEQYVETNIGKIPIAEYRDIAAQQAGFNSYADMRRQGYMLGNIYDEEIKPVNIDTSTETENSNQGSFSLPNQQNNSQNEIKETVKELVKYNEDVPDEQIQDLVGSMLEKEFNGIDLDDDSEYERYCNRTQELHNEIEKEFTDNGYKRNRETGEYIPSNERIAKDDTINFKKYDERAGDTLTQQNISKMQEQIEELSNKLSNKDYSIHVDTSRKSEATYIYVTNEKTGEEVGIRIANHYKPGVSGNMPHNISLSDYDNIKDVLNDVEKEINNIVEKELPMSPTPPNNPPTPPSPPNPPEPPEIYDDTEEKIAKLLEERPQKAKMTLQDKIDDLVTSTVNRGHFVDKLAKVSGNKQLKYKYDRMLSSANEGNYVVGEKQTNNEGKIIGKSVNEIWKPVEDAGKVQEFSDYLLHKLNIERMSLENIDELVKAEDEFAKFVKEHQDIAKYAPNTIKQIAEGKKTIADGKLKKVTDEIAVDEGIQELAKQYVELDKQVETMEGRKNKPVFGDTVTADDSKAIVAEYEKNNPEFKKWSDDIKTFNKNQLQNMVDAGLTSKETQELLNSMYDNYVRIHREVGGDVPVTNRNGRLKVNSPIKTAKGGNQDILPLKDSMAQQAIEVKKAISRNLFGQELLNTLNNGEEVQDYGEVLEEGKNGEAPTFTVFEEGKPITMKINEELYKAIKPAERLAIEDRVITQGLQKAVRFQKAVLTSKNLIFAFTNFVRDLQTATVNSKDTKKMLNNYRKLAVLKFSDIYEKNTGKPLSTKQDNQYLREMWELYKANGGESNTYFDFEKGTNVEPKGKVSKALKIMNDKIFGLNEVIEQMPRVAEFITTLENGGTIDEAMYNAADVTVNFKRGGDFTKFLDRNGVSFLNASIQGLDKQIRNLTDDGIKGAANFIIKCALLGIVPAVANHLLMGDDEDYEDLPNYIKDNYWLVKTGDDTFLRIPRGRDIPTFLGNVAARTVRASQGENKAFDGLVDTFSNTLAPNNPLTDNIFAPINAVRTNKSWNNSDIVSTSLQNKIPEQQYDAKTTEFAKWIGKNLKVSPKKVDYLLDQYTGGLGDILMPLNTKYAEERGPLSAKFVTDSVKNNKNVSLFYDMKNDLEKKKSSNVATDSEIYQLKYLNDTNKKVSELYKQMREIEASNSKDKEKKEKATEIQKKINALTKDAVEKSEDYGKRAEQHNKNKVKSMN